MELTLGDPARHFFMTRSVARVMGVNLTDALNDGSLAPGAYASMVTACRGCALVDACEEWLSRQTSLSGTPPPGCYNGPLLAELQRRP